MGVTGTGSRHRRGFKIPQLSGRLYKKTGLQQRPVLLGEGADQCRTHATGAQRLKRVFNIEIETCSACIEDPVVIKQILDHLKHKAKTRESRVLPESRGATGWPAERPVQLTIPKNQRFNSRCWLMQLAGIRHADWPDWNRMWRKVGGFLVIVAQCRPDSGILNGCQAGH